MEHTPRNLTYLRAPAEMHPVETCPWCDRAAGELLVTRGDGLPVHRCGACGFTYLAELPEDISVFYDDGYFSRTGEAGTAPTGYDDYDTSYTPASFLWLAQLARTVSPDGLRLFDLGAATGTFLEAARYVGFEGAGVELTEAGSAAARSKGLDVRAGMFDQGDWRPGEFDVVTALEVLEHVTDLRGTLEGLARLVEPGGALIVLVPNVDAVTLDRFGAGALDFHTSYEHTVYFDPGTLYMVIEEVFGANALSLYTPRVMEQGQEIGIAVGVIRPGRDGDAPERKVFDVLEGRQEPESLATAGQALTAALTGAKFYLPDLAERAIERASDLGASDVDVALARAQADRNRGRLHAAIAHLEPVIAGPPEPTRHLAGNLLIDLVHEALGYTGIEAAGLADAIRDVDARLAGTEAATHELDQTREALAAERVAREEADAMVAALEQTVTRETARLEALGRRLDEAERHLEIRAREIEELEGRVQATAARASALGAENLTLREDLNSIYSSRGWRALAVFRNLKGGSRAREGQADREPITAPLPVTRDPVDHDVTVSVIMPVFNKGRGVIESIDSVRSQTLRDVEIIVWDDGSSDDTTTAALAEAEQLDGVVVHRAANQGVIAARNQAMSAARGEFFVCLDPDDRIASTYLEKAVVVLRADPNTSLVYPWQRSFGGRDETWETADLNRNLIATVNHVPVCAVFRREVFDQTGGFSTHMADGFEDWEFWAHAAELGFRGRVIPEPLFEYYWSADAAESRDATARSKHTALASRIATLHPTLSDAAPRVPAYASPEAITFPVPTLPAGTGRPILLTMPWFTIGGADRVVETLIRHWTAAGRTVVAVTTHEVGEGMTNRFAELLDLTPYSYHLPALLPERSWFDFVSSLLAAVPDAVIFNVGAPWTREHAAEIDRRWPDIPIIDQQFNDVGHLASNLAAGPALAKTIVAYQGLRPAFLADPSRSESDVAAIYVGIEPLAKPKPDAIANLREAASIPAGRPYAVFVGRLAEEKRPDWLLPLADQLDARDTILLVVGNGPLGEELADDLGDHPAIRWLKEVDAVAPVYGGASAMVLASETEGIPLTLMESLSVGTPVVTTGVGGIPELADVPGVRVTDPNDRAAWIAAVLDTLASPPQAVQLPGYLTAAAMLDAYDSLLSRIDQGTRNAAR